MRARPTRPCLRARAPPCNSAKPASAVAAETVGLEAVDLSRILFRWSFAHPTVSPAHFV